MIGNWASDAAQAARLARRARPASLGQPPAAPWIAPTGEVSLDTVLDVVNAAAAPFARAPPPEEGTAEKVLRNLGGALGALGTPSMLLDTAAAVYLPKAPLLGSILQKMDRAMPAATTLTTMHVGIMHAHAHPPSLGVPLLSAGMLVGAGAVTVLVGGLPAARLGDIGLAVTCGTFAPPFQVCTGSSNVFIGGSRAARTADLTMCCNPASFGPLSRAMAAIGLAVAAANAGVSGSKHAAAQVAADAAVLGLRKLMGKDPGVPPGAGFLVQLKNPRVEIGGFPCPSMGEFAVGLARKLSKWKAAFAARRSARRANGKCAQAGHPVYLVTGETFDSFTDFVSGELFEWRRHYSSARGREDGPLGHGWRHFYQRALSVRLHRAVFRDWDGDTVEFPRFERGTDTTHAEGYSLRRLARGHYVLSCRNEPTMEFRGPEFGGDLPLTRVRKGHRELQLRYDDRGYLTEAIERLRGKSKSERRRFELKYDEQGHVVQLIEHRGDASPVLRSAYRYASKTDLECADNALEQRHSYRYDCFHRMTKTVDPRGYGFSYQYDIHGRCVETTGQDGLWRATMEYFPEERTTRWAEGAGGSWELHYDAEGFVTKVVDPYGGQTVRERDADGKIVREVDVAGRELRWLYDAEGAHYGRVDRFGYVHPPETQVPRLQSPFARRLPATSLGLHLEGAAKASREADLGAPSALLDLVPPELLDQARACFRWRGPRRGSRASRTPRAAVERDELGRLVREVDELGRARQWAYDEAGNLFASSDREGRVTLRHLGSWNLVAEERDPLGHATQYEYSALADVTVVVDPLGNATQYEYDGKQRLVSVSRAGVVRDRYVYDQGDHFLEKHDGDGEVIFRNEIHASHFVAKRHLASGGFHRFDYDDSGRIVEASTEEHKVELAYEGAGPPIRDLHDGHGIEHRLEGRTCKTTVLGRFAMVRDVRGDEIRLVDPAGRRTTICHGRDGLVRRYASNDTAEVLQYDGDGRLLGRLAFRRDGGWRAAGWSTRYTYTAEGDLVRVDDSARGTTRYVVDAAHRLTGETSPRSEEYQYWQDAAGNVLYKPGVGRLSIREGNRLTSSNEERFVYDARDRVRERWQRDGSVIRYTYDSFDMLVRVDRVALDGTAAPPWLAFYDGLGRRIRSTRGGQRREFYWDGDRLGAEVFPDGRLRIYEYASREALVPLGFIEYASREADPSAGRHFHVFSNAVGIPLCIEDEQGEIAWWADRVDPYGAVQIREGTSIEYNLRWPGHYWDPDTKLHYNRYRYYDPKLGRYLQPDPTGHAGSPVNLYAYAANPLARVDLLGLTTGCETPRGAIQDGPTDVDGRERPTVPPGPPERVPQGKFGPPRKVAVKYDKELIELTDLGRWWDARNPVVIYDAVQLEGYRVVAGSAGRLIYAQTGRRVDCRGGIYILDGRGNVYVHEQPKPRTIHHSSLTGGGYPAGAGEIHVQDGVIHRMDENSGHYGENQPSGRVHVVTSELESQGVDTSHAEAVEHRPNPNLANGVPDPGFRPL